MTQSCKKNHLLICTTSKNIWTFKVFLFILLLQRHVISIHTILFPGKLGIPLNFLFHPLPVYDEYIQLHFGWIRAKKSWVTSWKFHNRQTDGNVMTVMIILVHVLILLIISVLSQLEVLFYSGSTVRTTTHCTPTALRVGVVPSKESINIKAPTFCSKPFI